MVENARIALMLRRYKYIQWLHRLQDATRRACRRHAGINHPTCCSWFCSACARPGQVPLGRLEFLLGLFPSALVLSAFEADAGGYLLMTGQNSKDQLPYTPCDLGVWKRG